MTLKDQIFEDLKQAMKAREAQKVIVLRTLNSAIKDKEIELSKRENGLNDDEIILVIKKQAKKRKDAIFEYQKAGREELSQKEEQELKVLQKYLPEEMTEEQIKKEVDKTIEELNAKGRDNFGRVMQAVMSKLKNRADGALVNKIIKEKLN
ncbi:MAG: GatB/Yqey domain protein [Parcubacteria group bacterium GW2011_GWA2_31_28]|nr:MAG: GatB/Yqey domain protein [Parcubacteria group bacterium GW2011_GWA2_31_28]